MEMTIENVLEILEKHKLHIPSNVFYELKADIVNFEEPTTKNDLVTLTFSKGTLKYSCKDYVVYKKDWLRSHYGEEIDIMFGDSQYKEPIKNDLAVEKTDMIDKSNFSQEQYKADLQSAYDCGFEAGKKAEQEPRKGHWIKIGDRGLGWSDTVICKCSECEYQNEFMGKFDGQNLVVDAERADNYCPNCGADMREVEE